MKISCIRLQLTCFSLLALGAQAEPARIEGVDLYIDAPPGFTPATAFTGLQQIETFTSIEVREVASPFETVADGLSADRLVLEGATLLASEPFESEGRAALLLHLEQEVSGIPFNKWHLVIGDELRSLVVTATYPAWTAEAMSGPLRQSLLGAKWLRTREEQLFRDLPFTLAETQDLKFVKRTNNMLVLADVSETGALTGRSPSIVVGHLASEEELIDIKSIAHRQLAALNGIDITEILDEGETRIDGIRSYSINAKARMLATDSDVILEQVLAFQSFKYLLTQSVVEEALSARYAPQFDRVLASIRFKEKL